VNQTRNAASADAGSLALKVGASSQYGNLDIRGVSGNADETTVALGATRSHNFPFILTSTVSGFSAEDLADTLDENAERIATSGHDAQNPGNVSNNGLEHIEANGPARPQVPGVA